ncbi:hypothetical protein BDR03DRAFT_964351 [Suillus americanus]|nr:hypothetical protein BDR03DRAFT_964351 [Suillus americanus]
MVRCYTLCPAYARPARISRPQISIALGYFLVAFPVIYPKTHPHVQFRLPWYHHFLRYPSRHFSSILLRPTWSGVQFPNWF